MKNLLLIISLFLSMAGVAQSPLDSLQHRLDQAQTPEEKFDEHLSLADYFLGNDPLKAISHYQTAMEYAKDLESPSRRASALCGLADVYQGQGNYSAAEKYYLEAIDLHGSNKDGVAKCKISLGELYQNRGDYDIAIEKFYEGLTLYEEVGNRQGFARAYDNLGNLFSIQGNYDEALASYEKSIEIDLELNNRRGAGNTYNNMGVLYDLKGDYHKAVEHYREALDIFQSIDYKLGVASCLINLGIIHDDQGEPEEALVVFHEAIRILQDMNNRRYMAIAHNNVAEVYLDMRDFQNSKKHFMKGLGLARDIGAKSTISASYSGLTRLYHEMGDHRTAFEYQGKYLVVQDSLTNEKAAERIAEMRNKYQQELQSDSLKMARQEAKLAKLENAELEAKTNKIKKEHQKQQFILIIVAIGLLAAIAIAYFAIRTNRLRQKVNRELELKNFEINKKSYLLDKKNKNILDSIKYAQRIQASILPDPARIDKYFSGSFVIYLPKDIVSGDLYWLSRVDDRLIVTVADCTGHGVPGAFMSIMGVDALYQTVREKSIHEPGKILTQLESNIGIALKQKSDMEYVADGMELGVCSFGLKDKKVIGDLKFSGANIHLWRLRDGEVEIFRSHSQPLGGFGSFKEQNYPSLDVDTKPGDRLYLFSDGVLDQFGGPKGRKFKAKRVKALLRDSANLSIKDQGEHIQTAIHEWKGDRDQLDDICFLGMEL